MIEQTLDIETKAGAMETFVCHPDRGQHPAVFLLMDAPGVSEAIVYGVPVPGQDGKAGMAALVIDGKFDAAGFAAHVEAGLPPYAQPCFLRLIKAADTTGTFKYRKADLVADAFDPEKVAGVLYVRGGKAGYQKLTPTTRAAILAGESRL